MTGCAQVLAELQLRSPYAGWLKYCQNISPFGSLGLSIESNIVYILLRTAPFNKCQNLKWDILSYSTAHCEWLNYYVHIFLAWITLVRSVRVRQKFPVRPFPNNFQIGT